MRKYKYIGSGNTHLTCKKRLQTLFTNNEQDRVLNSLNFKFSVDLIIVLLNNSKINRIGEYVRRYQFLLSIQNCRHTIEGFLEQMSCTHTYPSSCKYLGFKNRIGLLLSLTLKIKVKSLSPKVLDFAKTLQLKRVSQWSTRLHFQ